MSLRLLEFDPDGLSGDDSSETGARAIKVGQSVLGDVSFNDKDATDYLRVASGQGWCVVRLSDLSAIGDGIRAAVRSSRSNQEYVELTLLPNMPISYANCDDGTIFAINANKPGSKAKYHFVIFRDKTRISDFVTFVSGIVDEKMGDFFWSNDRAGQLAEQVAAVRRLFHINDADEVVKQLEAKFDTIMDPKAIEIVMGIVEGDIEFYRTAFANCEQRQSRLCLEFAIRRADAGDLFDQNAILTAIQSEDQSLAVRAVAVVSKFDDREFAVQQLNGLLLDDRDAVANKARELLRNLR